jgi:NAD-dependent dihydropyrimidine dehydrogenase PreA subunit
VDEDKCTGKGRCREVCPKGPRIWEVKEKGGRKVCIVLDINYCLNCGSCVAFCPDNAIRIKW